MLERIVTLLSGFSADVRELAAKSAVSLMETLGLSLVAVEVTKKQKGSKAVAHNTADNRYLRVQRKGVDCPILLKPITGKTGFLGWAPVPDCDRVNSHAQLESFALWYLDKAVKRHEDYTALSVACTARQLGEDIANNTRQSLTRRAEKAAQNAEKIAAFVALPDAVWEATKSAVAAVDSDLVALVESARTK